MGILDAYKNLVEETKDNTIIVDDIELQEEINRQQKLIEEYDTYETINNNKININEQENEYTIDLTEYVDKEFTSNTTINTDTIQYNNETINESNEEYHEVKNEELKVTTSTNITPILVRAYCPICDKEIKTYTPTLYSPFTFNGMAFCKCECGWNAQLEQAYPHIDFIDNDTNEIIKI
jgi:hypothetical protein